MNPRILGTTLAASCLLGLLTFASSTGASADGQGAEHHDRPTTGPSGDPALDRQRGMVFDGLQAGAADGPCAGAYQASLATGHPLCTHGPDPAPDGIDVTLERPVEEFAAATEASTTSSTTGTVPCSGDGVTGNRVQAVYAVASDRVDRIASIAPLIPAWAAAVDGIYAASAAQTGGDRHVRFVTQSDCSLSVLRVVLSPTGDDNVGNTANELAAQGLNRPDRKYLVWVDASVYCGIAYVISDDRPTQDNLNNGRYAGYARVDSGCWGRSTSVEAHELMHTMGGVQRSAPHATSAFHCTDDSDRMCYADGTGGTMTYTCGSEHEVRFDCNDDDYFSTAASPTSYLGTHWNVANSSFLDVGPSTAPPPSSSTTSSTTTTTTATNPPPSSDTTPPAAPTDLVGSPASRKAMLSWTASTSADVTGYRVYLNGVVVATVTLTNRTVNGLTNGTTYSFVVTAVDAAGNESAASNTVQVTPTQTRGPRPSASFSAMLSLATSAGGR